jgi:hypothetical protein
MAGIIATAMAGITLTLVGGAMTASGAKVEPQAAAASVLGVQVTRLGDGVSVTAPAELGDLARGEGTVLAIELRNEGGQPKSVAGIDIAAADASVACRGDVLDFTVDGSATVAPHSTATVAVEVMLDAAAHPSCEAASFRLTYLASVDAER